jgi:hypothetical protein
MTPQKYFELLKVGNPTKVTGLCGRVLRGKHEKDFGSLSDDPNRRLVMLMGSDGLKRLIGKSGYEILIELGYMPDFIRVRLEQGTRFKLFVTPMYPGFKLATWENIVEYLSLIYPRAGAKIRQVLPELTKFSYAQIEKLAGYSLAEVFENGKADPRFMTNRRFLKSDGSVAAARAFLYHTCYLYELFSGNGYTKLYNGRRGIREYITLNSGLEVFLRHELLDIEVRLP